MSRASKSIRNIDLSLWTVDQLKQRLSDCEKMEKSVPFNKARHSWKQAKQDIEVELERRVARKIVDSPL